MTASTNVSWEIDGTPLQTYCSNVETVAGKYGFGDLRGSNLTVAYKPGQKWRRKYAGERTIPLLLWVSDMDPDTGGNPSIGKERQFHRNMVSLQKLLWTGGSREIVLTKKWLDPLTGLVVSADARAEAQPWSPSMKGKGLAQFGVDFLLADPFFYGAEETITLANNVPQSVSIKGDDISTKITISQAGEAQNSTITNSTPSPEHWVRIGTSVAAGDSVVLDVEGFTATRTSDDANLIGSISRSGSRNWMSLFPGTNTLTLNSVSGSGSTTIKYRPAYL